MIILPGQKQEVHTDDRSDEFQTPIPVCVYMANMIEPAAKTVLEPTPGQGNLVKVLKDKNYNVIAPQNFWKWEPRKADAICMNPPFTKMELSDNIIALVPWYTLINSRNRTKDFQDFGLVSVTNLSRTIFQTRTQVCILQMKKGYSGKTEFKQY